MDDLGLPFNRDVYQLNFSSIITAADPYKLLPYGSFGIGFDEAPGRQQVNPRLTPSQRTLIIATLGQSNISNSVGGYFQKHTPASNMVENLNFIDGGVYKAKDALLGCHGNGSNTATRLGTALIQNGKCDRAIIAPIGFSSSGSADWKIGGILNHRIPVLAKRFAELGYTPDFVIHHQGESDAGSGTAQAVSASNYQSMIDTFRANGINCPILICTASWTSSASPSYAPTRAAQAQVVNNAAKVFAGPDTDTLGGDKRYDGVHFNDVGSADFSTMLYNIIAPMIPV